MYWFLAGVPTSGVPSGVRPTNEGMICSPSAASTWTLPSTSAATSELVVPRSMPTITSVIGVSCGRRWSAGRLDLGETEHATIDGVARAEHLEHRPRGRRGASATSTARITGGRRACLGRGSRARRAAAGCRRAGRAPGRCRRRAPAARGAGRGGRGAAKVVEPARASASPRARRSRASSSSATSSSRASRRASVSLFATVSWLRACSRQAVQRVAQLGVQAVGGPTLELRLAGQRGELGEHGEEVGGAVGGRRRLGGESRGGGSGSASSSSHASIDARSARRRSGSRSASPGSAAGRTASASVDGLSIGSLTAGHRAER